MTTLLDTLKPVLEGKGLSDALGAVTGGLGGVSSLISGTSSAPPKGIAGFGPALRSLSLPNLDVSSVLGSSFASLKNALPSNPSSITGGLTSGIDQLKSSASDLASKLGEALQVASAIFQFTQIDFTGATAPATPAASGAGAGGGAGAGSGVAEQPPVTAQTMSQVNSALDGLPSPLTVDSFLGWLQQMLSQVNLDDFGLRQIASIGDLRDYLATLINWKNSDPNTIKSQLAGTLTNLDAFLKGPLDPVLNPLSASAMALSLKLHSTELAQIADGIQAKLVDLKTPVSSGSLAGAGASITALATFLDQYDQLKTALQSDLAALPQFQDALHNLPDDVEDQMSYVVSCLRPSNSLGVLDQFAATVKSGTALSVVTDQLSRFLERLVSWIQDLLASINFKVVTQPLQQAADAMKSVVDGLDNTMAAIQLQIQEIFGKVESALNLLDPATATTEMKAAVESFKDDIVKRVSGLIKPALDAITKVVDEIAQGVSNFDPKKLQAILHDAIQKIAAVLNNKDVAEVRKAIDDAAKQIDALSFAPFTGEVIKDMDAIASTLKSLGDLPSPLLDALHSALSVLPKDLRPITDPILDEFNKILNEGPVQVINQVVNLPKQLADQLRAFDPSSLATSSLSEPYNKLLSDMQGFKPSSLLDPMKNELNSFKDRLAQDVSPGKALQGLQGPFQELSQALDNFHPDDIIKPLDDKLKEVLGGITATVPLDSVFAQVASILDSVKNSVQSAINTSAMLDKARGILRAFANPQTQLDAWIAPILAKLDSLGDTTPLQASLASVSSSVDGATAASVSSKCDAALAPIVSALDTLDPQKRWANVVEALQGLPASAVDALPSSGQKSALKAALVRLNPSDPTVIAPFVSLAALRKAAADTKAALHTALNDWDSRYTQPDTVLGSLRGLDAGAGHLKQWIHDAVTDEMLSPLTSIFSLAAPALAILDAVVGELQKLVNDVQAKLADMLAGVDALKSIRDSLNQLLDRIKNFNLGFLRDSLKDGFAKSAATSSSWVTSMETTFNSFVSGVLLARLVPVLAAFFILKAVLDGAQGHSPLSSIIAAIFILSVSSTAQLMQSWNSGSEFATTDMFVSAWNFLAGSILPEAAGLAVVGAILNYVRHKPVAPLVGSALAFLSVSAVWKLVQTMVA